VPRSTGRRGRSPPRAARPPICACPASTCRVRARSGAGTPAAVAKLRAALATLPLGSGNKLTAAEVDRAVGRARDVDVQYQSNGGAIVRVEVRFGDWLETPSAADGFAVAVASMHLGAAPTARDRQARRARGRRVYRVADGKGAKNVAEGRSTRTGRLVLSGDAQLTDRLARGQVIIYVGKLQR
jgi:hypothetical protein